MENVENIVYLVRPKDAIKKAGPGGNHYSTFQTAYDAANRLQLSLGGSTKVIIRVGHISLQDSGNLVLTTDYNPHISIIGLNKHNSVLGDIIATSTSVRGHHVILTDSVFSHITLGNITTSYLGVLTGSEFSGEINLYLDNCSVGNLDTSINDIGQSGSYANAVTINSNSGSNPKFSGSDIGSIITYSKSDIQYTSGLITVFNVNAVGSCLTNSGNGELAASDISLAGIKSIGNTVRIGSQALSGISLDLQDVGYINGNVDLFDGTFSYSNGTCYLAGKLQFNGTIATVFFSNCKFFYSSIVNLTGVAILINEEDVQGSGLSTALSGNIQLWSPRKINDDSQTTNATPLNAITIAIPTNGCYSITAEVFGKNASNTDRLHGIKRATIRNNAGTLSLLGTVKDISTTDREGTLSTASFTITTSGTNALIQLTGVAATTIKWLTCVELKAFTD